MPRVCRELRREFTRGAACYRAERLRPVPPASPTGGAAGCPHVCRGGHLCATCDCTVERPTVLTCPPDRQITFVWERNVGW